MCGFVGYISQLPQEELAHTLQSSTNLLAHRGPDAFGYHQENDQIGLYHWRLSIQDLSAEANQPFHSASNRYVIVFNGEVYNFKALAQELQLSTRTQSDTEVLIEAFERYGTAFVEKLNGMFCIAILDKQTQQFYLFRDRLGIKPLYYYCKDGLLLFSSELKGLTHTLQNLGLSTAINKQAIANFLHLGYIPEHQSIFQNVQKFPKGALGVYTNSQLTIKHYWKAEEKVTSYKEQDFTSAKATLQQHLHTSIQQRLIAEVPIG